MKSKLILGTANFSPGYGINNSNGLNVRMINSLNKVMKNNNIKELDAAYSYQGVEKKIGLSILRKYEIYSKVPEIKTKKVNKNFTKRIIDKSLANLKKKNIKGIFFHSVKNLKSESGLKIYSYLVSLKKKGIIKKMGISVYSPTALKSAIKKFKFDMIQIPINIFDRRFLYKNLLKKMKNRGIEIHVRSIFLQGILLCNIDNLPKYFKTWKNLFIKWENWNFDNKKKKIETCLNFLNNQRYIDKLVIGVNNARQLEEIIKILKKNKKKFPRKIYSDNKKLLEPRLWKKKK